MAKGKTTNPLSIKRRKDAAAEQENSHHIYHKNSVCETDSLGHPNPLIPRTPTEIVVDATDGFIPLWKQNVVLRWRFQDRSMSVFRDVEAAKSYIREIFAEGILLWGDAVPVKFKEVGVGDVWDFETVFSAERKCIAPGRCTLASAFFPDGGRHELRLYPNLFEQTRQEQIETMAHELGHIFGLRHFFANITETKWRSEIFGDHEPFSIMNYGEDSFMTENDKSDLKRLYELLWGNSLTEINGTPVRQVAPFSSFASNVNPNLAFLSM
ncbi:reprolysin-like metallopeptidase [Roseobacter sp. EG26]|uniref:reprolysin-like metallopeptidase n=1 Tax=Roseobacter sp. EG26 TaxID=3412477 RepID=UPI003CE4F939